LEDPYSTTSWLPAKIIKDSGTLTDEHHVEIDGSSCYNPGASEAAMVRYAWALSPCQLKDCLVYNDIGLPAPPFAMQIQ